MQNKDIVLSDNLNKLLELHLNDNESSLIIYCIAGKLQIEMNEHTFTIKNHDMLLCRPEHIIGHYTYSPDMQCRAIFIQKHALDDVLYVCMREDNKWWEKAEYIRSHPIIHLNGRQQELAYLFDRLLSLYEEDDEHIELSEKIRRVFAQAAIYEFLSWLEQDTEKQETPQILKKNSRQDILFRDFMRLTSEQAGCQREVRWYAECLSVTPKYLSAACLYVSGKSASAIIQDVTVQEIKRLLRQTDLTIKEICVKMNFVSLSFFCKYAKQHLGMSANAYRAAEHNNLYSDK